MDDCGLTTSFASSGQASGNAPKKATAIALLDPPGRLVKPFLDHWQIACLMIISFCMHLIILPVANVLIYDEMFWVPDARLIVSRGPLLWVDYPAVSKLFIASGIWSLGDNPWGWRIPSVLFSTAAILLVYLIAQRLAGKRVALLAALLFTTENLVFTLSGMAMLDTFLVPFMLLSFLLYLRHRHSLSGLSLALAVACSAKAVLAGIAILLHWFFVRRKGGLRNISVFAVTSVSCFLAILVITDLMATGEWFNPLQRLVDMWTSQTSLTVSEWIPEELAHSFPTRPWQWILDPTIGTVLNPAEFRHIMMITPTIWVLAIPSIVYLLYRLIFVKEDKSNPRFVLMWFFATYVLWVPLELYTDRPMFLYYLLPTMGAICIAIAYAMYQYWQVAGRVKSSIVRKSLRGLLVGYLVVHVLFFLIFSPLTAVLQTMAA